VTPTLSDRIVVDASAELKGWKHPLRPEDCAALKAAADNITRQAGVAPSRAGILPPHVFVSSQPTGWGKSTVVCAAVRQIIADPTLEHVGVLVMVSALEQIPVLIDRMRLLDHQFAVRTSRADLNALGVGPDIKRRGEPTIRTHLNAQVLFIAQQKFPKLVENLQKDFGKMDYFKYRGSTRRVKLWDEAYLPMEGVSLTLGDIAGFADTLDQLQQRKAAKVLRDWTADIQATKPTFATFPDWIKGAVVSKLVKGKKSRPGEPPTWNKLYKRLQDNGGDDIAKDMVWLAGKMIRLVKDDYHSQLVGITYRRNIPYNIEPLLVFDAGGKSALNRFMAKAEHGKVELLQPVAEKTFRNLAVRFFDHGAGKGAHRIKKNLETYAAVVAEAVAEKPAGEDVLVIIRKSDIDVTWPLEKHILSAVQASGGDVTRLKFLTWGRHKATNEYKDVKHVIVVGLLQLPRNEILSQVYGSQGKSMHMPVEDRDVEEARMSQMIGDLNQAAGRGSLRYMTSDGDVPPGCTLDIIASSHRPMGFTNPIAVLRSMFKQADVQKWFPKATQTMKPIGRTSADIFLTRAMERMLGEQPCVQTTAAQWAKQADVGLNTVRRRIAAGHLPGITVRVSASSHAGLKVCRSISTH
jgi:hypothetical protein